MDAQLGINIAGHINGDFGLGAGVRTSIKSIKASGIPYLLNNLHIPGASNGNNTYIDFVTENPYPINFVHTNPNWIEHGIQGGIFPILTAEYFQGKYNIGYWAWELLELPQEWEFAFDFFDEIWTPSNFAAEAVANIASVPVIKVPHSIDLLKPSLTKKDLNLPEDKFIFLFMFDFGSSFERKNPLATIEAFKKAFGADNNDVLLIVKYYNNHEYPQQSELLQASVENCSSIQLINQHLTRDELNSLVKNCDCYVSLHRSEGFGLSMAEAMYLGKPVIATGYSSNLDFMNVGNSFLVKYDLITTTEAYGCYPEGSVWADADVEHAAWLMKQVFENPQQAKKISQRAAFEIKTQLSPHTVGAKIKERLEHITQSIQNRDLHEDRRWFEFEVKEHQQKAFDAHQEILALERSLETLTA
jgi:glycosyltransferase involved in cell wall biosynthesis